MTMLTDPSLTTRLTLGSAVVDREIRGQRVTYVRRHLIGIKTRTKFCDGADMTASALKSWENGYLNGLTRQGAERIAAHARRFDVYCSPTWLLYGIGQWPLRLSKEFIEPDETQCEQLVQEAMAFYQQAGALLAVVTDDTMIPLLYPGYYVGGIVIDHVDHAIHHACLIIDDQDHLFIRTLAYSDKAGEYNAVCLNPEKKTENLKGINVKQVAPIVWIRNPDTTPESLGDTVGSYANQ